MDKVEGILLNKFPYQDKHIIGHLLLRNGMKLSVVFYGAQGGGKSNKGSILQLGHMFSVSFGQMKSNFEILSAKEYSEKWQHRYLSMNPRAFYLLCFFCELIEKVAPPASQPQDFELDHDINGGLFRVLSNSLFYLDKNCQEDCFNYEESLFVFLVKALVEMGIFPQTKSCCISGTSFENDDVVVLLSENGGFAHAQFLAPEESRLVDVNLGRSLRRNMLSVSQNKFQASLSLENLSIPMTRQVFNYLSYQLNLKANELKTVGLVF